MSGRGGQEGTVVTRWRRTRAAVILLLGASYLGQNFPTISNSNLAPVQASLGSHFDDRYGVNEPAVSEWLNRKCSGIPALETRKDG